MMAARTSAKAASAEAAPRAPRPGPAPVAAAGGFDLGPGPMLGLGPPVQMLCAACIAEEERERKGPAPVEAKCVACAAAENDEDSPVQKSCTYRVEAEDDEKPVQADRGDTGRAASVHAEAWRGLTGADQSLPHGDRIQAAFGRHDISGVRTRTGGAAERASRNMGAEAFASGNRIGFRSAPSLRLAAHEAAHVVQQDRGVRLKDNLGRAGDRYERHADAVADTVAAGGSAEALLDRGPEAAGPGGGAAVQMQMQLGVEHLQEPPPLPSPAPASAPEAGGEGRGEAGEAATPEGDDSTPADAAFQDEPAGDKASGGSGDTGSAPAPAGAGGANAPPAAAGGDCAPACYRGAREEPEEKPDETPPNPPQGEVESESSAGDEEELEEVDNCPTYDTAASAAPGAPPAPPPGGAGEAAPAEAAGPQAAPGSEAQGGAGGGEPAPEGAGGGGTESSEGDMAASIALAEAGQGAALSAFGTAQTALSAARDRLPTIRSPMSIAAAEREPAAQAAQRRRGERRADSFFADAASRLSDAVALAETDIVAQLDTAQASGKAQIAAAMIREKAAISTRIRTAERVATAEAATTRAAVHAQATTYIAEVEAEITASIEALNTAVTGAHASVDDLETTTLDEINTIYATSRTEMEALGTTKGADCQRTAESFATQYEGFRNCTEDGFWDGNLAERRANAQAEATRAVGDEYNNRMIEAAQKRAREVTRNGRRADRCAIIRAANRSRDTLDTQLPRLVDALNVLRDSAVAQARATETRLIAAVDNGLASTLAALARQEHDQRQAVNDAGYMQQLAQEQIALNSAAAIQGNVARAVGTVDAALGQARTTLSARAVDPDLLNRTLRGIEAQVAATVEGLGQSAQDGALAAEGRLLDAALAAEVALAGITSSNDGAAQAITDGYLSSMRTISSTDNFATARTQVMTGIAEATAQSLGSLGQVFTSFQETATRTKADARSNLETAKTSLGENLDQSRAGLECEITRRADEAASKEPPAWKMIVAVLLVILVIIIVVAVTVFTAGAGGVALAAALGGPLAATIVVGAAVGAVVGGLMYMAQSLWTNQDITLGGLGKAVALGALFGAVGGGAGFFLGPAVGAVVGRFIQSSQVAAQLVTALIVNSGLDVVSQFVMGGFSMEHFSWESLGFSTFLTLISFGAAHLAGPRTGPIPTGKTPEPPAGLPSEAPTPAARPQGPPKLELIRGSGRGSAGRPSSGTGVGTEPGATMRGGPAFDRNAALKLDPMARSTPEVAPAPQRHLQSVPDLAPEVLPTPAPTPTSVPGLRGVPGSAAVAASAATIANAETGTNPQPQPEPEPQPQPEPDEDEQQDKEECRNRPPVVLYLPAAKSPHVAFYNQYIGQLQHRVGRDRSTNQLSRWRSQMRNWMRNTRPDLFARATSLGLTMEDLILPNWSSTQFFPDRFQVDHVIEMQVTPIGRESAFDLMFNYELLDQVSNGSIGPELRANIQTMREVLAATCNDNRWLTEDITFEAVEARGALFNAGRWTRFQIREGEHLDAYENLTP